MGVKYPKFKKLHLTKHFKDTHIYFKDDKSLVKVLETSKDKWMICYDGAIPFESELSMLSTGKKTIRGDKFFKALTSYIDPYISSNTFSVIMWTFDGPWRPPEKSIDTSRQYDPNAPLLENVSDEKFPISSDSREDKVKSLKKKIQKLEKKEKEGGNKIYIKKKNSKALNKNRIALHTQEMALKKILEDIKKEKIESWKYAKGRPENRKKVYKYLTDKFIDYITKNLSVGQTFILDFAVVNDEYRAVRFFNDGNTITQKIEIGSQVGEGEQAIMYHIENENPKNVIVHSYDTDVITYCTLNLTLNWKMDKKIWVRCKNFAYRTSKTLNEKKMLSDEVNTSKIYAIKIDELVNQISEKYGSNKVLQFIVTWGIFLGDDSIDGVHEVLQRCHSGPNGDKCTMDLIDKFLEKYIKKYNYTSISPVNVPHFKDNKYWYLYIDIKTIFEMIQNYRESCNLDSLSLENKFFIAGTCARTIFITNYILNQFRVLDFNKRHYPLPKGDKIADGGRIFGYEKNSKGETVQSIDLPPKLLDLVK